VARLRQVFAPRDREFFDLFEEAGRNIAHAADLLDQMLAAWPDRKELAREILVCEQEGDRITHDIISRLNQTFVTPIDREDILELASALDDVVDLTEEVADYLGLYRIEAPMEQAQRLAQILVHATRQVAAALPRMRGFRDLSHYTVEINRLENDGDRVTREAVASLFEGGIDPMVVIRWKDIFERLEDAIDACERVANVLEGVVIKNS
jgi:predicted phosphate transport protein (TIGR00153 family)